MFNKLYRTCLEFFQPIVHGRMSDGVLVFLFFATIAGLILFGTRLLMFRKRDPSDDKWEFVEVLVSIVGLVFFNLLGLCLIARKFVE